MPPILPTAPSAPPSILATSPAGSLAPARMPSRKMPKGRHLTTTGDRAVYDVDERLPGEPQPPQLEVTPITKYASDPGLVLGRQIAVNKTYICYGLKLGAIRVLNINTALRSLLKGHTQRVTDMAFFAEDVHLLASASVDGRISVWRIDEGADESGKPQITGKVITAIQLVTTEETVHPRICWHCHKQEVLFVGVGNQVLRIDTTKVGRGEAFSAEEPLKCSVGNLIDGVQFVGKHDADVTDLSMSQWMTSRLASASKDGMVKIWEDRKMVPLAVLRPHDGEPVNSVAFLTAPHRPDHIVLLTAGPLNREVKVWVSAGEEGWLLPSDSESWHCIQTLELRTSSEPRVEEAFFNQVVVLPQASLILLANAKKNAIYAVHVDYGPYPSSTRMDYVTEFTVTMPILSLTGTTDHFPNGEQIVQVYCVQTQAIQQYALDLSQCLPPALDSVGLVDTSNSHSHATPGLDRLVSSETSVGTVAHDTFSGIASPTAKQPISISDGTSAVRHSASSASSEVQYNPDSDNLYAEVRLSSPRVSGTNLTVAQTPDNFLHNQAIPDQSVEKSQDIGRNLFDGSSLEANSKVEEKRLASHDISVVEHSQISKRNVTHLITPSELLAGAATSSEKSSAAQQLKLGELTVSDIDKQDLENLEVEVKVVGESGRETTAHSKEKLLTTDNPDSVSETTRDYSSVNKSVISDKQSQSFDVSVSHLSEQSTAAKDTVEDIREMPNDSSEKFNESAVTYGQPDEHNVKQPQTSGPSSPTMNRSTPIESLNEQGSGSGASFTAAALSQIVAMHEKLNQLMSAQKEMQKQMSASVTAPITKEGKRLEASLGRGMEKAIKANTDAHWARFLEENAKHEKQEKERMQQLSGLLTNCVNKDFAAIIDKALKKEISAIPAAVIRAITPVIEKTISSAVAECFQKGVGDKAVSQLEKTVSSKLETTVARQIQSQFQTSGKQALQEALRSTLESSTIPAFEQACKSMFEQVDASFQKGMAEHTSAAYKHFESAHTPLALILREAINSVSSITQNVTTELAEGQQKILSVLNSRNQGAVSSGAMHHNNETPTGAPVVEAPADPRKEIIRLISDRKFEEAFTLALQRSDVTIVSWLCSQVDLQGICTMSPLPLSPGVLLALLQQLACDISKETPRKLQWLTDVAAAINPADPTISVHVRPIFEQVYGILAHQRSLSTTTSTEAASIRIILHVINSVLASCK